MYGSSELTVEELIERRGLEEVLHFTTNRGLLGVLATGFLKSRSMLNEDQYLEYLFTPNASLRKDVRWLPYVSMSITRINAVFYEISKEKWHRNEPLWWCALSFDSEILTHDGVFFTTSNNIYTGTRRGTGGDALEAMFAPKVHQYLGNYATRYEGMPDDFTTCQQAEVLYPAQVSTEYLRCVYFYSPEHAAIAESQCVAVLHEPIITEVREDVFHE